MRLPGSGVEPKTWHDFRGLQVVMRRHSRINILEVQIGREETEHPSPVCDVSEETQEDNLQFAAVCNIISGEVEQRPFCIRLPVSRDEIERA